MINCFPLDFEGLYRKTFFPVIINYLGESMMCFLSSGTYLERLELYSIELFSKVSLLFDLFGKVQIDEPSREPKSFRPDPLKLQMLDVKATRTMKCDLRLFTQFSKYFKNKKTQNEKFTDS